MKGFGQKPRATAEPMEGQGIALGRGGTQTGFKSLGSWHFDSL